MNTTDLIMRVRYAAFLPPAGPQSPDYTDLWILNELNDQQRTLFERAVVNSKQAYWLKTRIVTPTLGVAAHTEPQRAVAGGLKGIDIAYDATLNWVPLPEVKETEVWQYELPLGQTGQTIRFCMRGDQIVLLPAPDASAYALREKYYLRPPLLTAAQNTVNGGGTVRGLITAWNASTRIATVNALPFDNSLDTPIALTSGLQKVDVVRGSGWHEVQVVSAPQTISGLNITLGGVDDVSTVAIGDWIRVEEQTDWPAIPADYHRCLADASAIKILGQRGLDQKAATLATTLSGDLERFLDLLSPRVKDTGGEDIVMPYNLYGRGRPRGVAKYP